jgi:hypothetical protein
MTRPWMKTESYRPRRCVHDRGLRGTVSYRAKLSKTRLNLLSTFRTAIWDNGDRRETHGPKDKEKSNRCTPAAVTVTNWVYRSMTDGCHRYQSGLSVGARQSPPTPIGEIGSIRSPLGTEGGAGMHPQLLESPRVYGPGEVGSHRYQSGQAVGSHRHQSVQSARSDRREAHRPEEEYTHPRAAAATVTNRLYRSVRGGRRRHQSAKSVGRRRHQSAKSVRSKRREAHRPGKQTHPCTAAASVTKPF